MNEQDKLKKLLERKDLSEQMRETIEKRLDKLNKIVKK